MPKWNSWIILLVNSLIVLAAMLFVHFCFYGLKDISAYSRPWSDIGATAIFSVAYAYLFNKVTYHWRLDFAFGIFNRKSGASHECGWKSGTNFFNALFLGCLVMVMVFAMMAIAGVFMSTFFVFVWMEYEAMCLLLKQAQLWQWLDKLEVQQLQSNFSAKQKEHHEDHYR